MASFDFNYSAIYNGRTPVGTGNFIPDGTMADNNGDGVFKAGETVTVDGIDYIFRGTWTVTIEGSPYTFVALFSPTIRFVFGNVPPGTDPAIVNAQLPPELRRAVLDNNTRGDPFTPCFMAGTLIATPEGARAVETLAVGDLILTTDGRAVPVRWMGRKTVHKAFTPAHDFAPVRVTAGALGAGVPQADLLLTGDHALIVDGLAVNASALVNGTTIVWEPMDALPDAITYWHIETAAHEEILANGAPAETFCDYIGRAHFDNHQEYLSLYGCERIIPEMRRPRISARRQLPADLAARFGIAPFGAAVEAEFDAMMDRLAVA